MISFSSRNALLFFLEMRTLSPAVADVVVVVAVVAAAAAAAEDDAALR